MARIEQQLRQAERELKAAEERLREARELLEKAKALERDYRRHIVGRPPPSPKPG